MRPSERSEAPLALCTRGNIGGDTGELRFLGFGSVPSNGSSAFGDPITSRAKLDL